MSTPERLRALRIEEVERIAPFLPPGGTVLEIGGGSGWQSRRLAEIGFAVSAIELTGSPHLEISAYPTTIHDGRTIPFSA